MVDFVIGTLTRCSDMEAVEIEEAEESAEEVEEDEIYAIEEDQDYLERTAENVQQRVTKAHLL